MRKKPKLGGDELTAAVEKRRKKELKKEIAKRSRGKKNHVRQERVVNRAGNTYNTLTLERKKQVAAEYAKDHNWKATAERSGIAPGTMWNLMHKDYQFAQVLEEIEKHVTGDAIMDAQETLREISRIARSNMADYMELNAAGELVLNLESCTRAQLAAIQFIEQDTYYEGRGENATPVKKTKFKLHAKTEALKMLVAHHGLEKDPAGALPAAPPPMFEISFLPEQQEKKAS